MERFGFVGLPNAGKSSLFNALAGGGALAAPYPFATKEPNIGRAKVPDDRLLKLAEMSKTKTIVHATSEFVDIGGLVEGASKGEGLGNKFLANIREVDAIVFVLRAFDKGATGDEVPGSTDPIDHLTVVEIELALADLATVETQLTKRVRASKLDKSLLPGIAALEKVSRFSPREHRSTEPDLPPTIRVCFASISCSRTSRSCVSSTSPTRTLTASTRSLRRSRH